MAIAVLWQWQDCLKVGSMLRSMARIAGAAPRSQKRTSVTKRKLFLNSFRLPPFYFGTESGTWRFIIDKEKSRELLKTQYAQHRGRMKMKKQEKGRNGSSRRKFMKCNSTARMLRTLISMTLAWEHLAQLVAMCVDGPMQLMDTFCQSISFRRCRCEVEEGRRRVNTVLAAYLAT